MPIAVSTKIVAYIERYYMIDQRTQLSHNLRNGLLLLLALALLTMPVAVLAHAFTHFAQADVLDSAEADDDDLDLDDLCLDCLALSALSLFLISSGILLGHATARVQSLLAAFFHVDRKSFAYYSRAPPSH